MGPLGTGGCRLLGGVVGLRMDDDGSDSNRYFAIAAGITPEQACATYRPKSWVALDITASCLSARLATTPKLTGGQHVARGPDQVVGFALRPGRWTDKKSVAASF
jgi:hypothetical protein